MKVKGFLFDLDGTLVNSLTAVERAWRHWGEKQGIAATRILNFIHGKQAITSLRHFMAGASEEKIRQEFLALEKIEANDTEGIVALPGAKALLNELNLLSIPWAIVTSGSLPVASARIAITGLPTPAVLITAEQVSRGKPEPDAYQLGAKSLGLKPEECMVVEDAEAGIISGLAAGCKVIAVNPPANAPCIGQVVQVIYSLEQIVISKNTDGTTDITCRTD